MITTYAKTCTKCGREMPSIRFNKKRDNPDGLDSMCKDCNNERTRYWRIKNHEKVLEYNRIYRATNPAYNQQKRDHRRKYPEKAFARMTTAAAIRTGRLKREPCEACDAAQDVHAHHDDYSKPLAIRWLCRFHHNEFHKQEGNL